MSSKELNYKLDNLFKKKHKPSDRHPWKRRHAMRLKVMFEAGNY